MLFSILMSFGLSKEEMNVSRSCGPSMTDTVDSSTFSAWVTENPWWLSSLETWVVSPLWPTFSASKDREHLENLNAINQAARHCLQASATEEGWPASCWGFYRPMNEAAPTLMDLLAPLKPSTKAKAAFCACEKGDHHESSQKSLSPSHRWSTVLIFGGNG